MRLARRSCALLALAAGLAIGCGRSDFAPAAPATSDAPDAATSEYLLQAEPLGAEGVEQVREAAADDEEVVVVGRIGGSENPWIEGRAAFSIVDPSLKACSDIEGDTCPKPWDYCCETDKLPTATALVKVVDDAGELVGTDARELLDVKELSTVVVQGKAQRDDSGNLTVLAQDVYVRP